MNTRRRVDFIKLEKPKDEIIGGGTITGSLRESMCQSLELKSVMELVQQKASVVWVSDGRWSMHQLLIALLELSGPADVYLSSYALSETPARFLVQLKNASIIKKFYCILDNRVDTRTAATLQIIKSIADDFALIDTHAKVTVIVNNHWKISVIGSANYTENKRYEAGVIICSAEAADQQITWIKKALKDGVK